MEKSVVSARNEFEWHIKLLQNVKTDVSYDCLIIDDICLFAMLNDTEMSILPKNSCLFVLIIKKDSYKHATNSHRHR